MKSSFVYVACAATVLLVRPAGAEFIYELDHPVVIEMTWAITSPVSEVVQPESVELLSWRLDEPTTCIRSCLSPIHDLVTPTAEVDQQHDNARLDMTDITSDGLPLSLRR